MPLPLVDRGPEDPEAPELDLGEDLRRLLDDDSHLLDELDEHQEDESGEPEWLAGVAEALGFKSMNLDGDILDDDGDDQEDPEEGDEPDDEDDEAAGAEAVSAVVAVPLQESLDMRILSTTERWRNMVTWAFKMAKSKSHEALVDKGISLIKYRDPELKGTSDASENLLFVRWEDVSRMEARPITLDKGNYIKALVCCNIPKIKCNVSDILIKDTGTKMTRAAGPLRDTLPEWCVHIADFHNAQTFAGPTEPGLEVSETARCLDCFVHGRAQRWAKRKSNQFFRENNLYRCCKCLLYWHKHCVQKYVGQLGPIAAAVAAPFTCPGCAVI